MILHAKGVQVIDLAIHTEDEGECDILKKHRGLGRGLDALIPNALEEEQHQQEGQQSSES